MLQDEFSFIFWLLLVAIAGGSVWLARSRKMASLQVWGVTAGTALLTIYGVGLALYIGYVAPLSIMQDIVAAQEGLQGHNLPTKGLKPYIKKALEKEPVPSWMITIYPRLATEGQEEYRAVPDRITELAHPPFMVLFIAPFVYLLGVHGTFLVLTLLSVGFLVLSFILLNLGLDFRLKPNQIVLFFSIFLGWCPMFWVLRGGQTGAVLSGLIIIAWYCVRQRKSLWGGIAVGLATSLKMFPGLLLLYFLLRHRRAMVSAVATIVTVNLLTMATWGEKSYEDWIQIARFVTNRYAFTDTNYSLLAALHRLSEIIGLTSLGSERVFLVLVVVTIVLLCYTVLMKGKKDNSTMRCDFEYSVFVTTMLLLSPISWFHYFVVLLLPLAVLAKMVLEGKERPWSRILLLAMFLALAVPPVMTVRLHAIIEDISWRLGFLPFLLPTLAVVGMAFWIAKVATSATDQPNLNAAWPSGKT